MSLRKGECKPAEPLFVSHSTNASRGSRMDPERINPIIKRCVLMAGVSKDVTAHSMRHTNATIAIENGPPVQKVQRQLRHRDPKATLRYYRRYDDLKKAGSDFVKW